MKSKYLIVPAVIMMLAVAAVVGLRRNPEIPPPTKPLLITTKADGITQTSNTDPALVFQKAFWRRPTSDDKILHAERREWSTEDGVQKWQWFIALSPGPELLGWLKTNPFSLATTPIARNLDHPPAWFPEDSKDFQVRQNAEGRFIQMLSTDGMRLYATDSGEGFTPAGTAP